MGLLPDSYWNTPTATSTPVVATPDPGTSPAAPLPTPQETPPLAAPTNSVPTTPLQAGLNLFGSGDQASATPASSSASTPAIAPKSNAPNLFEYDIPNALGFGLPDPQTFENMSVGQKAEAYGAGAVRATTKLIGGLVSAVPQGIASLAATGIDAAKGFYDSAKTGFTVDPITALKQSGAPNLGNTKTDPYTNINLGPFGTAPSWFKTYSDALNSGAGPLAASLLTGGTAIGDITIASGITDSLGSLAKPKPTSIGEQVTNLEPIQTAITSDSGKVKFSQKADSVNEYYDTTPAVAKQYGGNPGNVKIKLSPVGDGTMEASIVKLSSDTSLKSRFFGNKSAVPSDFVGLSEVPLYTQNIPLSPEAQAAVGGSGPVPTPPQTPQSGMVPLTPEESAARGIPGYSSIEEAQAASQINIPNKVAKGTENLPITQDQIDQLDTIAKGNGLGDNTKIGIMNALTGKESVGDLTNAEYVKVATQLAKLNGSVKYSPTLGMNNLVTDWLGRRDSYFNSVEERTGIPTGQMYNRMENASRLSKIATETNAGLISDIAGKYLNDPQAGDLVHSYMTGDQGAITDNPNLDPQTKSDLISIAGKLNALYEKMGTQYGIPKEVFIEKYSPRVSDTRGAVTQYADPEQFPTGSNFFAKYKRTGGLDPVMTNEFALAQIYNHAGAKATYMPDALSFAKDVYDQADPQYKPAIKAYADAMAGNADAVERTLNNVGANLNQKLGWNLPPDATRKMVQLTMDTTYAATMGANPATYLRQLLSNPTYVYAENGATGLGDALLSYFKDPKAATEELQARGFRIRTADPYGSAIANEDTQFGKLSTQYRRLTSASLAPMNVVDSFGRYIMMKVSDAKFNSAIDLYNSGKLSWPQVETALDFDGMSPVDQNQIRQNLVAGDRQAAMDHLARVKIDDTQGTYRPNTLGRMMNGALGKPAFQFSTYADNYINMIGKWVKYGQWDKVVRLIGTQAVVYRTMLNQFGLNYSSAQGLNPMVPSASPLVNSVADVYNLAQAIKNNSQTDINTNKAALVQELQSVGFPGVEPARIAAFMKSYNAGPNAQGMYPVQSANGKLNYTQDFNDLFWNMFGFPTQGKIGTENLATDEINANTNYTTNKNQILQLIGNGQTDKATALMKSTGVIPTAAEINSYMQAQNLPLTIRLWKQLPKQLQAEFAPRVFSNTTSTP